VEENAARAFNTDIALKDSAYMFRVPVKFDAVADTTITFKLFTKDGEYIKGGLYQTKVKVIDPEYKAEIVSSTLPIALRNSWGPIPVAVRIKNVGSKPWTRSKTGLKFLTKDGNESPFYDPKDWLTKEIASVSLDPKQEKIAPGEEPIFKFTINPKGRLAGTYDYRINLFMSDKQETLFLGGAEFLEMQLRIDG
jgi:hypothetical protein